uniref:Uncharacterized protein n=1 Tax=Triticum urartu TaxID=4572 RepID=A0A8R7UQU4_TRIUA
MEDWCTKRSSLPSSGEMKPNPLVSLNHLTVPFIRASIAIAAPETLPTNCFFFSLPGACAID